MSLPQKPRKPTNRPGLSQIAYRIGDYNSFRERLLSYLACYLPKLKTRDPQDFAIALADSWAVVADVLSFYQERIANEGYLLTATERRSILELARAIGYELKPGVAASTYLALIVEDSTDGQTEVKVPQGTQVMSVPKEGELPQIFESSKEILARLAWNRLTPRQGRPHQITNNTQQLYLEGIATQLEPGDSILLLDREDIEVARYLLNLTDVVAVTEAGHSIVSWKQPLKLDAPLRQPQVFAFRQQAAVFGNLAPDWLADVTDETKRNANATLKGGIFQTINQGDRWFPLNQGLPNADILCLVVNKNNDLFFGTPGSGIFRSTDGGTTWQQLMAGLTNLTVQTLYVDWARNYILAGTPGGGVFRSTDQGENWSSIGDGTIRVESSGQDDDKSVETVNTGLPDTVVRSLVTCRTPIRQGSGTIFSNAAEEKRLTGSGTKFNTELSLGDIITTADGQVRSITELYSDTSLTIDYSFNPRFSTNGTAFFIGGTYIFAGTETGIYRSSDQGKNWYLKGLSNRVIRSLLVSYRAMNLHQGRGAIGGIAVTGVGTNFIAEITPGDLLIVGEQIRTVRDMTSETILIIDQSFRLALAFGTAFFIPQSGAGTITSNGTVVTGVDTDFDSELQSGDVIIAAKQIRTIEQIYSGNILRLNQAFEPNLENPTPFFIPQRGTGTITSNGTTVTGADTDFYSELQSGDVIIAAEQIRTIEQINPDNTLELNQAFEPEDLTTDTVFFIPQRGTGTIGGTAITGIGTSFTTELNSADIIIAAEQIITIRDVPSENILVIDRAFEPNLEEPDTAFFIPQQGTGTITSNDTTVTGVGTTFDSELQSGDVIIAAEQIRTIEQINPDNTLELNQAFEPEDLTTDTAFFIPQRGTGTITSNNTTVTGVGTTFDSELQSGDVIIAAEQIRTIEQINSDNTLKLNQSFEPNLENPTPFFIILQRGTGTIFYGSLGIGTITSVDRTVTFSTPQKLTEGDIIIADEKIKTITAIASDTELTINTAFPDNLTSATPFWLLPVGRTHIFAGTDDGIFRSSDYGETWIPANNGLSYKNVTSLATDFRVGTGAIRSDGINTRVIGNGTNFITELKPGDTIVAAGQTKVIRTINAETELTVDTAFAPDLPVSTSFAIANRTDLFAGTADGGIFRSRNNGRFWNSVNTDLTNLKITSLVVDASLGTGKITSNDKRVQGYGTSFAQELRVGDSITASGQTRIVTGIDADEPDKVLFIDEAFDSNSLTSETSFTINNLFAGTVDGGVFRSVDRGDNWSEINGDVAAISPNRGLATKEITSLAIAKPGALLASTRFSGFVEQEWPGFQLAAQKIDLDTLYTGILEDSWLVLVDGDRFEALQVGKVFDGSRRDFLLDTTITSIIPSAPVTTPSNFSLRNTTVLLQGEQLALALESLDVSSQQTNIFLDPIFKNKIFLSDFVSGLESGQDLIIAGKHPRAKVKLGGIARSQNWNQTKTNAELEERIIQVLIIIPEGYLLVGTDQGVDIFSSDDNGITWKSISKQLSEQNITSFVTSSKKGAGIIIGRGTEILGQRDTKFLEQLEIGDLLTIAGQNKAIINVDNDTKLLIDNAFSISINGTLPFEINKLFAGTDRGIFRFRAHTREWEQVNQQELKNIQTLAIKQDNNSVQLFAGTKENGVWRSDDYGRNWPEINHSLTEQNIRSLLVNPENNQIFAGTANNGVFRSIDSGKNWQQIAYTKPGTGTIASSGPLVEGNRSAFAREFKPGDLIIAAGQTRVVTELDSSTPDTKLTINTPFNQDLPPRTTFDISTGLTDMSISELGIYRQPDTVTISSNGITVTGTGINFLESLSSGDIILANNEIRTVNQIISDTQLTLDRPFRNSLEQTSFLIPPRSKGTISSDRTLIRGKNTFFTQELKVGDIIIAAAQSRRITNIISDGICTIDTPFDPNISLGIGQQVLIFTQYLLIQSEFYQLGLIVLQSYLNLFASFVIKREGTIKPGSGSILDGVVIIGQEIDFTTELRAGDTIIAAGQIRTVETVFSATEISINAPFEQDLPEKTPFFIPCRGQGKISSTGTTITGDEATIFAIELQVGSAIIADGKIRTIIAIDSDRRLTIDRAFILDLNSSIPFSFFSPTVLLASTSEGGVFRSYNNGGHWSAVNIGLSDLEIRSLAVHPHNGYLFVGTANGRLFRSTKLGNIWHPIDAGLSSQSVGAIAIADDDKKFSRDTNDILFAGAGNQVFRSSDYGRNWQDIHWQRINQGLSSLTVQAIAIHREQEKLYLFAGTREGAFSSTDGGQHWQPINDGLTNLEVQTLLAYPSSLQLFAGTKEGLFRSTDYGEHWHAVDIGIAQTEIRALAFNPTNKMLFAATFSDGVIRYVANRDRWIPLGLSDAYLQAMVINPANGYVFVGTTNSGIFRSSNQGNSWQQFTKTRSGTGTITSDGINVTGKGTEFAQELRVGEQIIVAGQRRTIVTIASENLKCSQTVMTIDQPFNRDLRSATNFTIDTGLTNLNITALAIYPLPGSGAIASNGTTVIGRDKNTDKESNTKFTTELKVGDTITAVGQTRTVTYITPGTEELTIDKSFTNLPAGTIFAISRQNREITNQGTIASNGTKVRGEGTAFQTLEVENGDIIKAVGQTIIIKKIISDTELLIDQEFTALPEGTPFTRDILLAGTAGSGIFCSTNQGQRWSEVNSGLKNNLEIRCLTVDKYNKRILAGTALGGVFGSTDLTKKLALRWQPLNTGLTNTDVQAIAVDSNNIFVGGIGILLSQDCYYSEEVQPDDWLYVLRPPTETDSGGQKWQMRNLDNFKGTLTTLQPADITLYPAADDDPQMSEGGKINLPPNDQQLPQISLEKDLTYSYDPATVTIYGNIVEATQGETISEEILGSGDGTIANQRFELQKPPLTFISATTPSGAVSTLKVYVNDVEWHQADTLYHLDKTTQGYIVRLEDDGTTQVIFGDGKRGARLPSGQENIVAQYRSGIGSEGNISAESLTILKTRPLGIEEVTNPVAATGGAEREELAEARDNAPLTIRTLERIVSLRDFEDFARTFAGIAKAQAVPLWVADRQLVHITVAAAQGDRILVDSPFYRNLVNAIDNARDPIQQVQVDSYERVILNLEAKIIIDPRYQTEKVLPDIRSALEQNFSFNRSKFGQVISSSEIIATIQEIEGVTAVDLDALYVRGASKALKTALIARKARWDNQQNQVNPAQLLFLDANSIKLSSSSNSLEV